MPKPRSLAWHVGSLQNTFLDQTICFPAATKNTSIAAIGVPNMSALAWVLPTAHFHQPVPNSYKFKFQILPTHTLPCSSTKSLLNLETPHPKSPTRSTSPRTEASANRPGETHRKSANDFGAGRDLLVRERGSTDDSHSSHVVTAGSRFGKKASNSETVGTEGWEAETTPVPCHKLDFRDGKLTTGLC